jgi:hypothetical protein
MGAPMRLNVSPTASKKIQIPPHFFILDSTIKNRRDREIWATEVSELV